VKLHIINSLGSSAVRFNPRTLGFGIYFSWHKFYGNRFHFIGRNGSTCKILHCQSYVLELQCIFIMSSVFRFNLLTVRFGGFCLVTECVVSSLILLQMVVLCL
jgi:hypothetical protein